MKKIFTILLISSIVEMLSITPSHGATQQPNYDQVCKNYANSVITEYAKCDYNLSLYEQAYKKWEEYVKNYKEREAKRQYAEFETAIEGFRSSTKRPTEITLTESDVNTLRANGVKANELLEHNIEYNEFYREIDSQFDKLLQNAKTPKPSSLAKTAKLSHRSSQLSLELTYYNMLHTFSKISKAIFDPNLDAKFKSLNHQYKVEVNLPIIEYERMCNATLNKLERVVADIQKEVNTSTKRLTIVEDLETRYNSACEAMDKIITELEVITNYTIEQSDTKEMVLHKIEHSTDVVGRFEVCANEYINSLAAYYEYMNLDMKPVDEERATLSNIISTIKQGIDYMKATYNQM